METLVANRRSIEEFLRRQEQDIAETKSTASHTLKEKTPAKHPQTVTKAKHRQTEVENAPRTPVRVRSNNVKTKKVEGVKLALRSAKAQLKPERLEPLGLAAELPLAELVLPEIDDNSLLPGEEIGLEPLPYNLLAEAGVSFGEDWLVPSDMFDATTPDRLKGTWTVDEAEIPAETSSWPIPAEKLLTQRLGDELAEAFASLEPEEVEVIELITDTILQVAEQLYNIAENDSGNAQVLEETLKQLCVQLLERLGLAPDEDRVENLLQDLKVIMESKPELDELDVSLEEGTHERKPTYSPTIHALQQLVKQKVLPFWMLGRLALLM